jgi:hypothetical protein
VLASQSITVHVSSSDPATLVLAALGIGLALASLVWQALTFLLTGSRVSVEVAAGMRGMINGLLAVATLPNTATEDEVKFVHSQGFTEAVVVVRVNNTGRGATSVVSVDLVFDDGAAVGNAVLDPPVPFTLTGESEQAWYFPLAFASNYIKALEAVKPSGQSTLDARGRVKLGSKKIVVSTNHVPIPTA